MLDVNGPAHIFYEAKEHGASIDVHFISVSSKNEIRSSAGLHFSQLVPYSQFELSKDDLLFIPGLDFRLISDKKFITHIQSFLSWVVLQHNRGAQICSVCTGCFLLAETGILNGRSTTTHWQYFQKFSQRFPMVTLEKDRLFVSSDNIHSSAGVSSGIDLSLYLVESLFGTKMALDIAKEVVIYLRRSPSDPQLSIFLQYRNHLNHRIHTAQDYLTNHLAESPTAEAIAQQVHMSKRNLTRLFKKTTGITIGEYVEKLRVEKAITLLAKGHKVLFTANQCGLKSSNQLRSILKKHQTIIPTEVSSFTD